MSYIYAHAMTKSTAPIASLLSRGFFHSLFRVGGFISYVVW
jgi:hypothetical protein